MPTLSSALQAPAALSWRGPFPWPRCSGAAGRGRCRGLDTRSPAPGAGAATTGRGLPWGRTGSSETGAPLDLEGAQLRWAAQ